MDLSCLNNIIFDGLAVHIDISDINSWDLNTAFTSVSLTKWSGAKSSNLNLLDFGLTAYDNGRVNDMVSTLNLTPQDLKVTLFRVGYNNATGGTFYDQYPISAVTTGSSVGNYFDLYGGYLQGFFKLQEYNHELLPARFNNGITIETIIKINQFNDGVFYLMGARAEDKYNPFYSGETKEVITKTKQKVPTGIVGQTNEIVTVTTGFSGVSTSQSNFLNAVLDETEIKPAFFDFSEMDEQVPTRQPNDNTWDNIIAFSLTSDRRISISRIDDSGTYITQISPTQLANTGWTIISLTFEPDEIIDDPDLLECLPNRTGTLGIYVNGRLFWRIKDYEEFFFKDFNNDPEKVIGVPYNISWGGGSFGLKHSWHFQTTEHTLYDGQDTAYINNNFVSIDYPLNDDPCVTISGVSNPSIGNVSLSADSKTFEEPDECNVDMPITVMRVDYTGTSAQTTGEQYYIQFDEMIELISNRDYVFEAEVYDNGIFDEVFTVTGSTISLVVFGTEDIEIIDEIKYVANLDSEKIWKKLRLKLRTKDNSGRNLFRFGILVDSPIPLKDNFIFFLDNIKYIGADELAQDPTKNDLLIQQNFDSSFIGGIQKLRIYDRAFGPDEILHNASIEIRNTPSYGFRVTKGGRIIYR